MWDDGFKNIVNIDVSFFVNQTTVIPLKTFLYSIPQSVSRTCAEGTSKNAQTWNVDISGYL